MISTHLLLSQLMLLLFGQVQVMAHYSVMEGTVHDGYLQCNALFADDNSLTVSSECYVPELGPSTMRALPTFCQVDSSQETLLYEGDPWNDEEGSLIGWLVAAQVHNSSPPEKIQGEELHD
ncbi:MAG: hypothetical protein BYD32DRAFT_432708 [Podila humilis]|nr:MAG: hypothetical protein BYD32DRAFT_432708 [Podila humilis]